MIDLHCHLLPGIDDGPATLAEAVELARMAVADGITTIVVTPHIHPGRYDNHREKIEVYLRAYRLALAQQGIPLELRLGAEVRVSLESLELLQRDQVPFLGEHRGWRVLLLELPHGSVPVGSLQFVEKLLQMNIRPLLAHPERNRSFMDNPRRIDPFLAAGCWLQLTAGSVTGDFGRQAQKLAHQLLDEESVRVVASDAHNRSTRPPRLSRAHALITQRWGDEVADDLMRHHPRQILQLERARGVSA
jgi:protein-tyrosine phosphatase